MFRNFFFIYNKIRYRFVFGILAGLATFLFFSLLFASTPFNPIQYKLHFIKSIFNVTPQGWAFFTRDAREEQIYIYKISNDKLIKINQRHSNLENFLGLSREVSKLAIELENITGKFIKNDIATKTTWNYDENIYGEIPHKYFVVDNPIKKPIICGKYLVVYQENVPWAWSTSRKKIKMPAKVIKLNVKCQK